MKERFDYRCVVHHPNMEDSESGVCSFQVKDPGTFIQFLANCREYNVSWYVREDDENINEEYVKKVDGIGGLVEDFNVSFGTDAGIQIIEVWLK